MKRLGMLVALMILVGLLTGCGGSRTSGKYNNQDKPKPVEKE